MSRIITLDTMKNLSIDEIIKLYQLGYKLKDYRPEDNKIQNRLYSSISHSLSPYPVVDPVVNFGKATVSTGYDSFVTSIDLNTGDGLKFPDPSTDGAYNVVWWDSTDYPDPSDDPNKEIVRVIAKIGDTLTIERAQEGTVTSDKNILGKTYNIILSLTAKTIIDIQNDYITKINTHTSTISGIHGVIGNVVGTSDIQSLTYKDITDMSNNVIAKLLKSATTAIDISSAQAPISGQVLTAISSTEATWQTLTAPTCFFVSILASPSSGTFPLPVNFNSTVIGGIAPYIYLWTFGDGTMSTNPAPNHTYTVNGTFTSTLTVTDSIGNTATSATTITVLTGVGLVANGLGISESIALPDFIVMYNAGPSVLDTYIFSDFLTGIYNASADAGSPVLDTVSRTESVTFINV